jgi:CopG antitoxin of type II toxin-antitoxin system
MGHSQHSDRDRDRPPSQSAPATRLESEAPHMTDVDTNNTRPDGDDEEDGLVVVESTADIPRFANEDEEHQFWSTHVPSEAMLAAARADPAFDRVRHLLPTPRGTTISLRLEGDVLSELRRVADRRGIGYQTLIKRFIIVGLHEERKGGMTSKAGLLDQ